MQAPPLIPLAMPDQTSVDAPFWHGLAAGNLHLQRCRACRQWAWPPQWRCGSCGSWTFDWPHILANGIVYALIRSHHTTAPEMAGLTPYTTVLVALPDAGGARLLGMLIGAQTALGIGSRVCGEIQHSAVPDARAALRWRLSDPCGPNG